MTTKKTLAKSALAVAMLATAAVSTAAPAQARNGQIAAGVAGFAIGALVGAAVTTPSYHAPAPVYHGRPAPWTPAWYSYCSSRYRSFNPNTGYFVSYSGHHVFCR